jgi:hypothetical protein
LIALTSDDECQPTVRRLTLKAFANSSPGLPLATLGIMHSFLEDATLKELRRHRHIAKQSQLLQSCEKSLAVLEPRVSKQTLGWN